MGLALALVLLALGAIAFRVRPPALIPIIDLRVAQAPPARDPWLRVWWALAAALALVPVLRDAVWVVDPVDPRRGRARLARRHRRAALACARRRAGRDVVAAAAGARAHRAARPRATSRWTRSRARPPAAPLIAAVLLAIFVPLLASADAAFAQFLDDLTPDTWAIDQPVARALVLAAVHRGRRRAALRPPVPAAAARAPGRSSRSAGSSGRCRSARSSASSPRSSRSSSRRCSAATRHVLDTAGLTYAEYARSGFAQLLVVAALTLAVIAAARRWARDDGRLLNVLLAALCLLTLVVLASALKRLGAATRRRSASRGCASPRTRRSCASARCSCSCSPPAAARRWLPRADRSPSPPPRCCCSRSPTLSGGSPTHNVERFERTGQDRPRLPVPSLGADAAPALKRFRVPAARGRAVAGSPASTSPASRRATNAYCPQNSSFSALRSSASQPVTRADAVDQRVERRAPRPVAVEELRAAQQPPHDQRRTVDARA